MNTVFVSFLGVWLFVNGAGAQCTLDPQCWFYADGCSLMNCPPFNRSTPVTCQQCVQMCREKTVGEYPHLCAAASYDWKIKQCDLFAVNELTTGQLGRHPFKVYFRPTGSCDVSTAAPSPPPAITDCPSGQVARIVAVNNYQYPALSGQTVPNVDRQQCAQACISNQIPGGGSIECHSAQFKDGQCTVSTGTAVASKELQPGDGSAYFQKFCFDANSVGNCAQIFEESPQMILVGLNRQTVDGTSLQDCVQKCLDAQKTFNFPCNSAQFFYNGQTQNCILNDETAKTHPELFEQADQDSVTYIETMCSGGTRRLLLDHSLKGQLAAGDLRPRPDTQMIAKSETTDLKDDVSSETPDQDLTVTEETKLDYTCRARMDSDGKKNCFIGEMTINGQKRVCLNPSDC